MQTEANKAKSVSLPSSVWLPPLLTGLEPLCNGMRELGLSGKSSQKAHAEETRLHEHITREMQYFCTKGLGPIGTRDKIHRRQYLSRSVWCFVHQNGFCRQGESMAKRDMVYRYRMSWVPSSDWRSSVVGKRHVWPVHTRKTPQRLAKMLLPGRQRKEHRGTFRSACKGRSLTTLCSPALQNQTTKTPPMNESIVCECSVPSLIKNCSCQKWVA